MTYRATILSISRITIFGPMRVPGSPIIRIAPGRVTVEHRSKLASSVRRREEDYRVSGRRSRVEVTSRKQAPWGNLSGVTIEHV